MFVKGVGAKLIKNSRGEKTVEIILKTYHGKFSSSAPSGKSRGKNEVEPYNREGIKRSLKLFGLLAEKLQNQNFNIKGLGDLTTLDEIVKKFERHYGNIGGNFNYALQTVFLKAAAKEKRKELWEMVHDGGKVKIPMPVGNCIGGGLHSHFIDGKKPDFQEFLLIGQEETFSHAVTKNIHAYDYARKILHAKRKNDENAWMTDKNNEEVLEVISEVAKKYNLKVGVDFAASTFFDKGYYSYKNKNLIRDRTDQVDYTARLIKKFDIFYSEDPMDEEDFSGFKQIKESVQKNKLIVGDDLTTTNIKSLRHAVSSNSINALIIKPNQIGDLLEVKKVVDFCKKHDVKMIFSHRSGETMDDAIADFAVGFGADYIKSGIFGPERLIKLKRVMDIERQIKNGR